MIKLKFEQETSLDSSDVIIEVRAHDLSDQVRDLMTKLAQVTAPSHLVATIPLITKEQVIMAPVADIVGVEIISQQLCVHLKFDQDYWVKESLKNFLSRLTVPNFLQISRNAAINLNQLQALEAAFSGNMMAKMFGGQKFIISRSYVPNLKQQLGL